MLLFAVFDNDQPAKAWSLRHAHLLGPDEQVIPGDVHFDRGLVRCDRRGEGAAAVAMQFPVKTADGGDHLITLRTCLLPQRTAPYLLSLELARHRLMKILNKLEEWALFDLAADDPVMKMVEETLRAFTAALLVQKTGSGKAGAWYTFEAEQAARLALATGVQTSEMLARRQADVQHGRRVSGELAKAAELAPPPNALTDDEARIGRSAALGSPGVILSELPRVGCAVNPAASTPALENFLASACDFVTLPMRWVDMEPTEGKYSFAKTDKWIEWAVTKAKLPVAAGPLIDLRPGQVPEFLYIWEHDYETLRDVVIEHIKTLVTRYRRTVGTWTVCSGLPCAGAFKFSYEQVLDLTRTCVMMVKKLQPPARVIVEIAQPWGEYTAAPGAASRAIPPTLYGELMNQLALQYDTLGVRIQMGQNLPGRSTRDVMAISSLLDRLAALDKPISVTALGTPSRPAVAVANAAGADGLLPDPGHWRREWNPETQAEWLTAVGSMIAGKPYVQSLCWQGLYDLDVAGPAMPGGGLVTSAAQAKPALAALAALRDALRTKKPHLP